MFGFKFRSGFKAVVIYNSNIHNVIKSNGNQKGDSKGNLEFGINQKTASQWNNSELSIPNYKKV